MFSFVLKENKFVPYIAQNAIPLLTYNLKHDLSAYNIYVTGIHYIYAGPSNIRN